MDLIYIIPIVCIGLFLVVYMRQIIDFFNEKFSETEEVKSQILDEQYYEKKEQNFDNIQLAGYYIKKSVMYFIYSIICSVLFTLFSISLLLNNNEGVSSLVSIVGGVIVLYFTIQGFISLRKSGEFLISYKETKI